MSPLASIHLRFVLIWKICNAGRLKIFKNRPWQPNPFLQKLGNSFRQTTIIDLANDAEAWNLPGRSTVRCWFWHFSRWRSVTSFQQCRSQPKPWQNRGNGYSKLFWKLRFSAVLSLQLVIILMMWKVSIVKIFSW